MLVNGGDCSVAIKTAYREMGLPYAEETLREEVLLLKEEAAIEGDGVCGVIRKSGGVSGCVVTPLTMGTVPVLLYAALGRSGLPVFVSETRNVYRYGLDLAPRGDSGVFDLVQDRGGERRLNEGCGVRGFELRFHRGEAVHLKLDICGKQPPAVYPYYEIPVTERGERFSGDCVSYLINGAEYRNIYGLTLSSKKIHGTKTELRIKRVLQQGADVPEDIEELVITARLGRDSYEYRQYGMFRISMKYLVLAADETSVDCADAVIGPLRYYCAGRVHAEVFASGGEVLA
jgi:hypothetical protein